MQIFQEYTFIFYLALSINRLKRKKMEKVVHQFRLAETKVLRWADANSHRFLRWSIGLIYIMYGGLKFFPHHSPAEQLAVDTIEKLTFGLFSGTPALITLAIMETLLGLCLLFGFRLKLITFLAIGHMMGTFMPMFFFPEQVFTSAPLSLSLVGQYILKNLVIVGALFVLYAKSVKKQGKVIYLRSSQNQENRSDFANDQHYKQQPLPMRTQRAGVH